MNTTLKATLAALLGVALLSSCSSINIGVGLPIGRFGGISVGGTIPLPTPEPTQAPTPAASAASSAAAAAAK